MISPTKKDITAKLAVLAKQRNGQADFDHEPHLPLLQHVADYLMHNFDVEMIENVEAAFGRPLSDLRNLIRRTMPAEFSQVWRGKCDWLRRYLDLTSTNEAPSIYHAISALTCASMVMRRDFYVNMGFFSIYPPLATMLVGPSGLRKTTAINTALRLVDKTTTNIIREKVTPEALIEQMKPADATKDAIGLLVAPEMSVTFGKAQYLQGFIPLITRLLDHDCVQQTTRGSGVQEVERVGFGVLAGTTVPWITEEMNTSVVSGGFTSRFLISYEKATPRVFFRSTQVDKAKLTQLRDDLADLVLATGEVQITKIASHLMEEWYKAHKENIDNDDLMSGYRNRKLTHIVRLAMIFSVLHGKRQIDREHVFEAAELLTYIEHGMFELYNELGRPSSARNAIVVEQLINTHGGQLMKKEILRILGDKIPQKDLRDCVDYMIDNDTLSCTLDQSVGDFLIKVQHGRSHP